MNPSPAAAIQPDHLEKASDNETSASPRSDPPVLTIHGKYPIFLQENWGSGIGGGLWSTGLALAYFFQTPHFLRQLGRMWETKQGRDGASLGSSSVTSTASFENHVNILELGSGNGFLSVCLAVAARMTHTKDEDTYFAPTPVHIVATDTAEHLSLMQSTVDSNLQRIFDGDQIASRCITVCEYLWGTDKSMLYCAQPSPSFPIKDRHDNHPEPALAKFDLIIGSDLAYRDELHDPLIAAFEQFTASDDKDNTPIILLGVTMLDTKPIFFHKLVQKGFQYEKLADHLLEPLFRGTQFGIFVIARQTI
jgi:hypothetical protein